MLTRAESLCISPYHITGTLVDLILHFTDSVRTAGRQTETYSSLIPYYELCSKFECLDGIATYTLDSTPVSLFCFLEAGDVMGMTHQFYMEMDSVMAGN